MDSKLPQLFYFRFLMLGNLLTLKWDTETSLEKFGMAHLNEKLYCEIGKETGVRTLSQNSWYWGIVLQAVSNHTGHTCDELHRIFKGMFLPLKKVMWKGKECWMTGSTTGLNKTDFRDFIERIRAEVSSLGIIIPDPTQV